jgi:hypothetical protein
MAITKYANCRSVVNPRAKRSEGPRRGILGFPGLNLQYHERLCTPVKTDVVVKLEDIGNEFVATAEDQPGLPPLPQFFFDTRPTTTTTGAGYAPAWSTGSSYDEDPLYNDCCYEARPEAPAAPPDPVDPVPAPAAAIPLLYLQNGRWCTRLPRSWSFAQCLAASLKIVLDIFVFDLDCLFG